MTRLARALEGPRLPVAVGLLALVVGLIAWRPAPLGIWHDDGVYALLARALAGGDGYHLVGVPGAPPSARFPPVYPAVLAPFWLLTSSVDAFGRLAVGLNLLLLAAAAGAFAVYARDRLGLGAVPAAIAAVAGWLHVQLWFTAFVPLSEPLFVLLLVIVLSRLAQLEGGPDVDGASQPSGIDRASVAGPRDVLRRCGALALLLLLLVHTRSAGVAFAVGAIAGLAWRRGFAPAAGIAAAVGAGMLPWWWWSRRSAEAIAAPLRDMLGGYSGWLGDRIASDPAAFAASLPAAALDLAAALARAMLPGLPPGLLPFLGPPVVLALAAGLGLLARRSTGAAVGLAAYLGMILVWPFRDPRLVAPIIPLVALCLVLAGDALTRPASESRVGIMAARALAVLWIAGYTLGAGGQLLDPASTGAQAIRTRQLEGAVAATLQFTEPDAVVGAPELWPAIPLHTGRLGAPSAPFRPGASDRPTWGLPEDQYGVWEAAGLDYVITEAGGRVHGAALDRLDATCPGSLRVVARWEGQALVRLGWDAPCRARLRAGT